MIIVRYQFNDSFSFASYSNMHIIVTVYGLIGRRHNLLASQSHCENITNVTGLSGQDCLS